MIDVRFIDVNVPRDVIRALAELLTDEERARADRYRFEDDRRRSIVARAATRRILSRMTGAAPDELPIVEGEHGKPEIAGKEIEFNASHSGDLVALAFARTTPVGIDVERRRTMHDPLGIARRFFSEAELAFVENAEDVAAAFFTVWTAKEAIVKASGKGIGAGDLRGFTVPFGAARMQPVTGAWSVATLQAPMSGYHAALAARSDVEPVETRTVDASSLL
ncbi:MAG TPA: 4'-phosphopantetheinyl transferase superfamily protein [Thermoanaerobaculia bacterium]|nr:4'-phosphopantetheinyl transferase superfamily protein [Thermoanaerobaculia bacterium]